MLSMKKKLFVSKDFNHGHQNSRATIFKNMRPKPSHCPSFERSMMITLWTDMSFIFLVRNIISNNTVYILTSKSLLVTVRNGT